MDFILSDLLKYSLDHSSAIDPMYRELERETHLKTLAPQMLSGPLQGRFLALISSLLNPKSILEIGTFTGYGSLCLAEGLDKEGILFTIESKEEHQHIADKYFKLSEYSKQIKLLRGDALEIITDLDMTFDLIFIDGAKHQYVAYYELVIPKLRRGGIILADNVLWDGKVIQDNPDRETSHINSFNKLILEDDRVNNFILPIRDGLNIITKK